MEEDAGGYRLTFSCDWLCLQLTADDHGEVLMTTRVRMFPRPARVLEQVVACTKARSHRP